MRIICSKEELAKAVGIVSKSVPAKTNMPILECILLEASSGTIKMTANDMELGIETKAEGKVTEEGSVALNAKTFSDIVRKLPDGEVSIKADPKFQVSIVCEKAKFNLAAQSGKDFPKIPEVEKEEYFTITEFDLKEAVRQTIFSTAAGGDKKMAAELFEVSEDALKVVALDGHRISIRNLGLKDVYISKKVIVPSRTLLELCKIIGGSPKENVDITFSDNHVMFEFGQSIVVSRLIDGEYFKIDQMLSMDYNTKTRIHRKDFLECIDRATLLVKENDKKPIIMDIREDTVKFKVKSKRGSWDEDMKAQKEGKDLLIGFNPRFLMEALRAIDDDEVELYFMNAKSPCIIRNEGKEYIYLILPVNITAAA